MSRPVLKYVGGDPSLDFVNSVDWTAHGPGNERLTDYGQLLQWALGAGVLSLSHANMLRRLARQQPAAGVAACARAHQLRNLLQRLFSSVAKGQHAEAVWRDFNRALARTLYWLQLTSPPGPPVARRASWSWRRQGEELDSVLWAVVWSAAQLLVSEDASRIRICGGCDCGWMYVDRSRNRLRRWCDMKTCGTAAKSQRRRAKHQRE